MKHEPVHSKLDEIAHVCTRFDLSVHTSCTRKPECTRVATFTQLASGNWRVQVRRKTRYVAETFRRRKDGEEWALEMERNIDRNGSSKPRAARNVRTFGDLIDLHDEDMHEVGKPPRRSKTNRILRDEPSATHTDGTDRQVCRGIDIPARPTAHRWWPSELFFARLKRLYKAISSYRHRHGQAVKIQGPIEKASNKPSKPTISDTIASIALFGVGSAPFR